MSQHKVIILGGGVGGLCSAWHLSRRGFEIDLYEAADVPGGKARSYGIAGTGQGGRADLPGEHGLRIFPSFYKHMLGTLKEVNGPDGRIFDRLLGVQDVQLTQADRVPKWLPAHLPLSPAGILRVLNYLFEREPDLTEEDLAFFSERVWQLLTSCRDRRLHEYEKISWWDYMQADRRSTAFNNLLVIGITRSLVASRPDRASVRTVGYILIQMMFGLSTRTSEFLRVLDGPTNETWIDPMVAALRATGRVRIHTGRRVRQIECSGGRITSVEVEAAGGERQTIRGDSYLFALPVERMVPLLTPEILAADPSLGQLKEIHTEWMVGLQFFLNEDVSLVRGHTIYLGTPWCLTSVSQPQFWERNFPAEYGNGKVRGVISVVISNWDKPGLYIEKPASACNREEIIAEVWESLKRHQLDAEGRPMLTDAMLETVSIDHSIEFDEQGSVVANHEPLMVNLVNTWNYRPRAYTRIENMYFASDYVQTNTDLACMESTDEAARRATNAIIDASGLKRPHCKIYKFYEPPTLIPFRRVDQVRFNRGQPWNKRMPGGFRKLERLFWRGWSFIGDTWATLTERRRRQRPPRRLLFLSNAFLFWPLLNVWRLWFLPATGLLSAHGAGLLIDLAAPLVGLGLLRVRRRPWILACIYVAFAFASNLGLAWQDPAYRIIPVLLHALGLFGLGVFLGRRDFFAPFLAGIPRGFRRSARRRIQLNIQVNGQPAISRNLSAEGAYLKLPSERFSPGEELNLAIRQPDDELSLKAGTVRVDPDGVGIAFRNLNPDQRRRLRALL